MGHSSFLHTQSSHHINLRTHADFVAYPPCHRLPYNRNKYCLEETLSHAIVFLLLLMLLQRILLHCLSVVIPVDCCPNTQLKRYSSITHLPHLFFSMSFSCCRSLLSLNIISFF